MNREELERLMKEQGAVARGESSRRDRSSSTDDVRRWLNIVFLAIALAGIILYFVMSHTIGIAVVSIAMIVKIIEFIIRFFF